jgi:rRNA maturation RNase YbeY
MAFPMEDARGEVWGEVYISLERAKDQAISYSVSFEEEFARLIVHGILHLNGYDDSNAGSSKIMRQKEDFYLKTLEEDGRL